MKKILITLLMLFLVNNAYAKSFNSNNTMASIISNSGIDKSSISISVKSENGKRIYELNDKMLVHPASVQKILTLPAAMDVLGEDYNFTTKLYKRNPNTFLIELGADPYLQSNDLKALVTKLSVDNTKKILIDDSIVEKKDWGEGWQWDDDLNISMPKFNAYNLDNNLLSITIMPNGTIINPSKFPLIFINNLKIGNCNDVNISIDKEISENTIVINGTINTPVTIVIPVNNLKRYFNVQLTRALEDNKIYLKEPIVNSVKSNSDTEIVKIVHPISVAQKDILENSNNMVSEILMKLAAHNYYKKSGTDIDGIKLFNIYCSKLGLDTSNIRLVDASGVSKNNLVTADFISEYLVKQKENETLKNMATPGIGTLKDRMLPLKDNLKAKTGTLSDISSIAGYLLTKNGNKVIFSIMINDPKSSSSDKKLLENYLIREMYLKF